MDFEIVPTEHLYNAARRMLRACTQYAYWGLDGTLKLKELDPTEASAYTILTPIASFGLAFDGSRLDATAIRGSDFDADGRLTFVAGDRHAALAGLDGAGTAILPRSQAERLGVGVGDSIAVTTADGLLELGVTGIVEHTFPGQAGESVLVGWPDALDRFGVAGADAFAVRFAAGREAEASAGIETIARELALTPAPISHVQGAVGDALDHLFNLLDLLALAAVAVAALGIVNTLSMDTLERVRELGMLRAVGMSRRQVWRSVLVEAGILRRRLEPDGA